MMVMRLHVLDETKLAKYGLMYTAKTKQSTHRHSSRRNAAYNNHKTALPLHRYLDQERTHGILDQKLKSASMICEYPPISLKTPRFNYCRKQQTSRHLSYHGQYPDDYKQINYAILP